MPKYFPLAFGEKSNVKDGDPNTARVKLTGETRAPRRGEWYLSGAIPEGYMAPNDLGTEFQICTLVHGEFVWTPTD